jgi:hypothetical protein
MQGSKLSKADRIDMNKQVAWVVKLANTLTAYVFPDGSVMMPCNGQLIAPTPEEEGEARVGAIKQAFAEMKALRDTLKGASSELEVYDAVSEAIDKLEETVGP